MELSYKQAEYENDKLTESLNHCEDKDTQAVQVSIQTGVRRLQV